MVRIYEQRDYLLYDGTYLFLGYSIKIELEPFHVKFTQTGIDYWFYKCIDKDQKVLILERRIQFVNGQESVQETIVNYVPQI